MAFVNMHILSLLLLTVTLGGGGGISNKHCLLSLFSLVMGLSSFSMDTLVYGIFDRITAQSLNNAMFRVSIT